MRKKQLDIEWIVKNHLSFLQGFGLNEAKIREHYEVWKVEKISATINEHFWYILQNIISAIAEQVTSEEEMYQLNYDTYSKMWDFLICVEKKNGNHIMKLMHQNRLRLWKHQIKLFKQEVVMISEGCCSYCDSLHNKSISFEEALEKQYLAFDKCTRETGCNCTYVRLNCLDENERLIRL